MNNSTINTLLPLLDKLGEQVENAMVTPEGISLLEKDRLNETLRRFYDVVDELPVVNQQRVPAPVSEMVQPVATPLNTNVESVSSAVIAAMRVNQPLVEKVNSPVPVQEVVTPVQEPEVTSMPEPVIVPEVIAAPKVVSDPQPVVEEVKEVPVSMAEVKPLPEVVVAPVKAPVEEKIVETRAKHLHAASMFEEQATVAARYSAPETIGDKVTKDTPTRRLSDQLKSTPLAELKRSIGINVRFALINELFGGDQQSYLQSIESINHLQTYEEAHELIHHKLTSQYNWKPQSERFRQFDELVRRRFNA